MERITIAAYVVAALACWTAALSRGAPRSDRRFWAVAGAVMTAFAVSKQLDLQTTFSQLARAFAAKEGLLSGRRPLQVLFIILCAAGAAGVAFWVGWQQRRRARTIQWAGLSLVCITAFVVVRAVSYHDVDVLIDRAVFGMPLNNLLELSGLIVLTLAGAAYVVGRR